MLGLQIPTVARDFLYIRQDGHITVKGFDQIKNPLYRLDIK